MATPRASRLFPAESRGRRKISRGVASRPGAGLCRTAACKRPRRSNRRGSCTPSAARPRCLPLVTSMADAPIVEGRGLKKAFMVSHAGGTSPLNALDDVNFDVMPGETLGLVGESGSGKSTAGRVLVGLIPAPAGTVSVFGRRITGRDGAAALRAVRSRLQFVFQDPYAALNPRMRVGSSVAEPLEIAGKVSRRARSDRVAELVEQVGLPKISTDRYPHEFSGGQRQRIVIARSLALSPDFIVCDEPVSALDVSMQAQIVNLLMDLQQRLGLTYLFIAHDLAVVRIISTRVAVMYAGSIVETAPKKDIYAQPQHPYTKALLDAVPRPDPAFVRAPVISGEVPSLLDPPKGCRFHPRCPLVMDRCRREVPRLAASGANRQVACHLFAERN